MLQAPPKDSKDLFLQYAALEEQYGLARTAMEVYDRAVQTVPQDQRLPIYDLYLARASQFFGIAKVCLFPPPPPLLTPTLNPATRARGNHQQCWMVSQ